MGSFCKWNDEDVNQHATPRPYTVLTNLSTSQDTLSEKKLSIAGTIAETIADHRRDHRKDHRNLSGGFAFERVRACLGASQQNMPIKLDKSAREGQSEGGAAFEHVRA